MFRLSDYKKYADDSVFQTEAALAAIKSYKAFIPLAWHVIEPAAPFQWGWHIDAIAEHLEAVTRGQIRNLLINMPPRHAKSSLVSVLWQPWEWISNPSTKWLFTAYNHNLSVRDNVKARRLILSPWYQKFYSTAFQLAKDQKTKVRYDNNQSGYRIATSVGGGNLGEGGDRIICDDGNNSIEAESKAVLESTAIWWKETMSTRLNNPKTGARVIVAQRVSQLDLSAVALETGGYDHLCLPAEYEGSKKVTSIGWSDPRKEPGELLWPDRFTPDILETLKKTLGKYGTAGQLQQRPSPRGGSIILESWFKFYTMQKDAFGHIVHPKVYFVLQSWDTAFKEGEENDYSAKVTLGVNDDGIYLLHFWKGKVTFPDLEKQVVDDARKESPHQIIIEDKASGPVLIPVLKKRFPKLPIKGIQPKGDKIARLHSVSPYFENGLFHVPRPEDAPWVNDYIATMTSFPACAHDDEVDATSQAIQFLVPKFKNLFGLDAISILGR